MIKTQIITHRGIDGDNPQSPSESSRESFERFLSAGFGLEFDVQLTKDSVPVISHNQSIRGISGEKDIPIAELSARQFLATPLQNGQTISLEELIDLMNQRQDNFTHALHLKHTNQTKESVAIILDLVKATVQVPIFVFDVKPGVASYIHRLYPELPIGASVAHTHDILRYTNVVGKTLLSVDEVILHKDIYDWVWLDEWDLADANGVKKLYTPDVTSLLKRHGFQIAMVSPELHATSPNLLGGEAHPDGAIKETVQARWMEMLATQPEAICTDYPNSMLSYISP